MSEFPFENTYEELGEEFYFKNSPLPVSDPKLIVFNQEFAKDLGLDSKFSDDDARSYFSGNKVITGSQPLAMAYSGHQFGHFSPQLGDGRAVLLGNFRTPSEQLKDLQLKGSGKTYFSRGGDGRSALGPVLREYLLSEAMHKLGIPTTRALAAVTTGENVVRETLIPGGIITRISNSFVRVGTFQYFSSQNDYKSVKKLADYVLDRNYPNELSNYEKYRHLLREVIKAQAYLISKWMSVGFIHGVMNTDNMSICGETIDYGPCAFMDEFNFNKKFSFIDKNGRYAYSNQPHIALWNLTRFAESILSLLSDDQKMAIRVAEDELNQFPDLYEKYWLDEMLIKLGLEFKNSTVESTNKLNRKYKNLVDDLLNIMAESNTDFTQTFYELSNMSNKANNQDVSFIEVFSGKTEIVGWLKAWRTELVDSDVTESERQKNMCRVNPVIIPRNHQVEKVIRAAEDNDNFSPFHELNTVLQSPYSYDAKKDEYMKSPTDNEVVVRTFCGT